MDGESHRESSVGLPRNSHDTENPATFDPNPSDTEKYGRVQVGRSHPESGAVIDNVLVCLLWASEKNDFLLTMAASLSS